MPELRNSGRWRMTFVAALTIIAWTVLSIESGLAQDSTANPQSVGEEQSSVDASTQADPVDFAAHIFPILKRNCLECHGPELQEAEMRVDQSTSLIHEDFVVPGDAANSRMYEVLISDEDDRMPPPAERDALPTNEIVLIKSWIEQGAKWSDISSQIDKSTTTGDPLAQDPAQFSPRASFWLNVWRAFGDCHPATVHFPIALLVIGGVFALFGLRGSYRCSDFAFYCLWLGAITAIMASVLGWSFAWNEGHTEDPFAFDRQAELFWHRWTGVLLSILAFLVAVGATIARRRDPDNGTLWKLCLILLAGLTIYVGHAGGELTHRRGYRRLYELFGVNAPAAPAAQPTENGE